MITSSQGRLAFDTPIHQPNLLVESKRFQNTILPAIIPETMTASTKIKPENISRFHQSSHKTLESLNDLDDSDGCSIWNYTLSNDVVTIPELGTFKRKKHFNGLVTAQLIEKMLYQSTPEASRLTIASNEPEKAWNTVPLSTNDPGRRVLHAHNTNIPTIPIQERRESHNRIRSRKIHGWRYLPRKSSDTHLIACPKTSPKCLFRP